MRTYSRRQRQRQRRRLRQNRSRNVLPQLYQHRKMLRDRHRKHPVSAQMIYDCAVSQKRRSIHQLRHRRSKDGVLTFKKRQKKRQSCPAKNRYWNDQRYLKNCRAKNCHACARMMCAHDRTRRSRKSLPHQRHRNKAVARMCGRQRNHAQKKPLRVIVFIQRNRKFTLQKIFPSVSHHTSVKSQQSQNCVANYCPKRRQKTCRTFGVSSRLAHGRRDPLNHLPCAA